MARFWVCYRSFMLAAFLSIVCAGSLLYVGATFFHKSGTAVTVAEDAQDKTEKVEDRATHNSTVIKQERRRNRRIEKVIIRAGIAKRGPDGKLGPAGPRGPIGRQGEPGAAAVVDYARLAREMSRSLSDDEIKRLAAAICATHPCQGMPGRDGADGKNAVITDAEIQRAADLICGGSAPCPPHDGAPGPAGIAGPAISSFGFFPPPPGSPHYTCTDPEGDLTYDCVPG